MNDNVQAEKKQGQPTERWKVFEVKPWFYLSYGDTFETYPTRFHSAEAAQLKADELNGEV